MYDNINFTKIIMHKLRRLLVCKNEVLLLNGSLNHISKLKWARIYGLPIRLLIDRYLFKSDTT